jgi:hypothetical protein
MAKLTSVTCWADKTLDKPLITAAGDRCLSPTSRIAAADIVSVAVVTVAAVDNASVDPPVDDAVVAGAGAGASGIFEAADVEHEIVSNQRLNDEQSLTTLKEMD